MTSAATKELFNAGGQRAEKMCRKQVTVLMRINNSVEFFHLSKEELVKFKKTSVLDVVKAQTKKMKFDGDLLDIMYRLLAQSMFGVDEESERDKDVKPSILQLGSFCRKNHLDEMADYYKICAVCGEDIEITGMIKMILSAVETTPAINKIVGEIVDAVPFLHDLEAKLADEEGQVSNSDGSGSSSSSSSSESSSGEKRKPNKKLRKRKAAKAAKKRMRERDDDDDEEDSSSDSAASSIERCDEKEEAELAEKHAQVKKSKTRVVYERALSVFFPIVVRLMVEIALDKIFTFVVTQFMAKARKMESSMKKALSTKRKAFESATTTTTTTAAAAGEMEEDDHDVMGDEENEKEFKEGVDDDNDYGGGGGDDDDVVVVAASSPKKAKLDVETPVVVAVSDDAPTTATSAAVEVVIEIASAAAAAAATKEKEVEIPSLE